MKSKIIAVIAVFLMSASFFVFPVNAKANSGETTPPPTTEAQETQEETETPKENENALTPDGNMTLVDDISSTTNSNKQFITLVTKTGNYFYLIIDRDDEGNNTVHFLNQVDEEDLFSLMKEDAQAIKDEIEKQKEPVEEEKETVPVVEKEEKEESKMNLNFMPLVAVIGLSVLAGGILYFVKTKKKKTDEIKPDPDADYLNDEDEDDEFFDIDEDKLKETEQENKV